MTEVHLFGTAIDSCESSEHHWWDVCCGDRHEYLMGLQERNERLFFRVLHENTQELLPIIGLPAVGAFCELYGLMFRAAPRGLYISLKDKGAHLCELLADPACGIHRCIAS
jgi:hypothetical protein